MRSLSCLGLVVALGLCVPAGAAAAEPMEEKLLLGFEEADFERLAQAIKLTRKEVKPKEGPAHAAWEMPGLMSMIGQWRVYRGKASQGEHALGIGGPALSGEPQIVYSPVKFKTPPEPYFHYGLLSNGYALNGSLFSTCGVFRRIFPSDWSDYDLLRLDVLGEEVRQTLRISLEDEEIGPPVVRNFVVEPGQWVTLEVDLRAAARERSLDLKRMATLVVGVTRLDGARKPGKPYVALLDNLRLSPHKAPARLPIVRDSSSLALPAYYRASQPTPEKLPEGRPDRSPLQLGPPAVIPTEKPALVAPVGWVAAYDNQHLLLGFNQGNTDQVTNVLVLHSRDGGKTWRGLDGGAKPTPVYVNNLDHGTGRGDVVGGRADVVVFTNLGCFGPVTTSLRLFARKLTFTGQGWEVREVPDLVDCDLRHCNSNHSVVRTPDGRLWAAYGMVGRLGTNLINVRYSDDDGLTWKGWAEGKSGALPGSVHAEKQGVGFGVYTFEEPCLVPFGKGIACIWQERQGYEFTRLLWTCFDGKTWAPIQEIPQPRRTVFRPVPRPPLHAVSLGCKEIFLVGALWGGVLHYRDGQWQTEPVEVPPGSRLCVAGDKTVVVVAGVSGGANKGPVVLQSWQRSAAGRWSGPVELAREEAPLSHSHDGIYVVRPGLVVQPYAPPNFVPVAWTCERQKWVKVLRVPVGE